MNPPQRGAFLWISPTNSSSALSAISATAIPLLDSKARKTGLPSASTARAENDRCAMATTLFPVAIQSVRVGACARPVVTSA